MSQRCRLLLCASKDEVADSLRRLQSARPWQRGTLKGLQGEIEGHPVVIAWSGEGPRLARQAVLSLGDAQFEEPLLVLGVAGALHPGAAVGDLVVAQRVRYGDRVFEAPQEWLDVALRFPSMAAGDVMTVDRIVDTDEHRAQLWREMGEPARGCVDMESGAFAEATAEQGRSLLVVRAVSDRQGDRLPAFLGRCRRPDGSIDRRRVAFSALLRPWTIPQLIRLGRHVSHCSSRLDELVRWWLPAAERRADA